MSPMAPGPLAASHARTSLSLLAGGTHVNLLGNVHGGVVMRLWHVSHSHGLLRAARRAPRGVVVGAIPPLAPETADEHRRMREAEIRRAHRLARRAEIDAGREIHGH